MWSESKIKSYLYAGLLLFFGLHLLQGPFAIIKRLPLHGSFYQGKDVPFTFSGWFEGDFQSEKAEYLNNKFGFRSVYVHLYCQLEYSLFSTFKANGVEMGKDGMLYEYWYIQSALGIDYMGQDSLQAKADKIEAISDTLASLNKDLIVLLAPGKGSYFSEYYPERWDKITGTTTNNDVFSKMLSKRNVNLFDAHSWFLQAKDTTRYPLFPKTGIHWSKFGEYLVMDSLIKYIENLRGISMTNLVLDSIEVSTTMRDTDDDMEKSMNLLVDLPDFEMAYPKFRFEHTAATIHPRMLTIGDSFYWGMFSANFSEKVFSDGEFWYYFKDVFPKRDTGYEHVADLNIMDEILENDILMLLCTETNIEGYNFVDYTYDWFFKKRDEKAEIMRQERITHFQRLILADSAWYSSVKQQAVEQGISIEQAVLNNAEYLVWKESQNKD